MSVGYQLINQTKNEKIAFSHLPVSTNKEIAGHPVSSAIVAWYLLKNQGDLIQFISDTYGEWPFPNEKMVDTKPYLDVTERIIAELIEIGIFQDNGVDFVDEDEPHIYIRAIKNIWLDS